MASQPIHYNVGQWVEENEKYFLPPICNKMMHNAQLKVFYVGGPNQRKDYHLEEGEELFYMKKGDMCLKILEHGAFKDIHIKQGQVFLLPGKIPHSPQRDANTVGLVIERERLQIETDGLRYFIEDGSTVSLFEKWFYCDDLGSQLGPIIKEFFGSEQFKTGKPIPEEMLKNPPWTPDETRSVEMPFDLMTWVMNHFEEIQQKDHVRLFSDSYQSDVLLWGRGPGSRPLNTQGGETFLWQLKGESRCNVGGRDIILNEDDTLLVPMEAVVYLTSGEGAVTMTTKMDPNNKSRAFP
ncbi:hypothetical protein TCAL_00299 [Tigriopus californicus]|uniref:3-hydroxyanthranilate 3,4-dioxygenase n=1 Tax=Tigriopus californicus TaxID=6832 RepID=A0A553P3Y5_TIGCA|nr:3-hydroxyanthranilate 3,4-dioxygenase-like [Tigriopus californicus]TRY72405.1 hypothetical protein TCAL_00299 [Tigriopus californicus]|eukprot:TCALIF_00299-PA protein Name:"Similar to Haao 3-hydroxyanthranilate 3,4-dioxygenase (Rattus norvegicus)" AED:0.09 eAED:0.09 QI:113/1/1/1/1/1/4/56/294